MDIFRELVYRFTKPKILEEGDSLESRNKENYFNNDNIRLLIKPKAMTQYSTHSNKNHGLPITKIWLAKPKTWKPLYFALLLICLTSCSDFVTVELPKNQLIFEVVFEDPATVEAALKGIYIKMRDGGLLSGHQLSGLPAFLGVYTDDLDFNRSASLVNPFQNHTVRANNVTISSWWKSAYNQIYAANAVIEGVGNSMALTLEDSNQFKGEALFIRAYMHLLLVAFYGDIPYITTTDYIENTNVSRLSKHLVYDHIIIDLELAQELLPNQDFSSEKVRPYTAVANAALAQACLYAEDWTFAEAASTRVIDQFGSLEPDLDKVFLKEASGTIWQFKSHADGQNTNEGNTFIFVAGPPSGFSLRSDFVIDAFEVNDHRKDFWIEELTNPNDATEFWYHAFKYKERSNTFILNAENEEIPTSVEYSIQFRLAEQYLIRAEARANLGDIFGAQEDLNQVRNRAGLGNTPAGTLSDLLEAILQERRVEFFTEKGLRWLDLKRLGKAAEVLAPIKPNWRDTNVLFPIPETELLLNPNLLPQNAGY